MTGACDLRDIVNTFLLICQHTNKTYLFTTTCQTWTKIHIMSLQLETYLLLLLFQQFCSVFVANKHTANAGLSTTSLGTWDWLTTKNDQTRSYSGGGRQGRMFLLCLSPEGHNLLLNTRGYSGLLAMEINKFHHRFKPLKSGRGICQFHFGVTQLAAGSSFGHRSLQVGRNSLAHLVSHSALS